MIRFILRGKAYNLTREDIEKGMIGVQPEAIRLYYVEINGKKYPPKQILSKILGLGKVEFTTMDASTTLRRIGYKIKQI